MIAAALVLGCSLAQEGSATARFEPGMVWTYAGRVTSSSTGRLESSFDFPFRASYLALPGDEPGDLYVLLCIDFDQGVSSYEGQEHEVAPRVWGSFLHLAPDLSRKTMLMPRGFSHPAADRMEFAPFPPPDSPWRMGMCVEQVRMVKVDMYDYRTQWNWRADDGDDSVRLELAPNALPVQERRFGDRQELLRFKQAYELEPKTGLLRAYESTSSQVDRHSGATATTWDRSVAMRLVAAETVGQDEQDELRAQFTVVRKLMFAMRPEPGSPGRREVDQLLARLAGSRVHAVARDLLEPMLNEALPAQLRLPVKEQGIWDGEKAARLDNAPAPDFTGEDLDGNRVALADLRGKVVLLNVWASW